MIFYLLIMLINSIHNSFYDEFSKMIFLSYTLLFNIFTNQKQTTEIHFYNIKDKMIKNLIILLLL